MRIRSATFVLVAACSMTPQVAAQGVASSPAPSYAAPPGAPYAAVQTAVRSPSGELLGATLTLPCGARGKVPAVVLLTGTGPQDRDEAAMPDDPYRPFRQIADTLSRRGIAVLRVDDRGLGGPHRSFATVADAADDVRAALALLRARPEIDTARLGLLGHSEGAATVPLVAVREPSLRALVLMGGPAKRLRDAIFEQVRVAVERDTALKTQAARDSALRVRTAYQEQVIHRLWPPASLEYDARVPARRLARPAVLVMHGATDWQVPPQAAREMAAAFLQAGNRDVTVRVLPGIDHLMLRDPSGVPGMYDRLPSQQVPPEVLGPLADWLAARLGAAPSGGAARNGARRCGGGTSAR
jgi:dienelactone hydrolase